ncbi:phosphoribosylglycinamide formyltransferase [Deltaproteobacteria bacterium Smac51]|nr:phosphoribosylglycinamide formyltransferase [Deltaproteobacteria bacterium Smac51]
MSAHWPPGKWSPLRNSGGIEMKPIRLGIMVSGRGSNMEAILKEIDSGNLAAEVGVVISDNPTAGALNILAETKVPTLVAERSAFRDKESFEKVLIGVMIEYRVELVVLAGYMRLLGPTFIQAFSGRIINIHPSLLPAFPGLNAQRQALDYGVKVAGCTVHFVNEQMDGGRIIAQAVVPVLPNDDVDALSARILKEEHRLLPQVIGWIGEVVKMPQHTH